VTLGTILRLGRVSNLPTVWTNALAGAVLAGAPSPGSVLLAALALSLFYAGGMWLNDAFDAEVDARERPDRPIPMGEVGRDAVFAIGFALLIAAMLAALLLGNRAAGVAVALGAAIVLYDWLHKRMALSPVIMGTARFLAYGLGAAAVGPFAGPALLGALGLFTYVVGLTYAAKQEAYDRIDRIWPLGVLALPVLYALWQAMSAPLARFLWLAFAIVVLFALRFLIRRGKGDVPRGVVALIAGITLYDAVLIAAAGEPRLAILAAAGFALTLVLQRLAPGT
jgi:4-hydroxybenzoate polyprenyltransferase